MAEGYVKAPAEPKTDGTNADNKAPVMDAGPLRKGKVFKVVFERFALGAPCNDSVMPRETQTKETDNYKQAVRLARSFRTGGIYPFAQAVIYTDQYQKAIEAGAPVKKSPEYCKRFQGAYFVKPCMAIR